MPFLKNTFIIILIIALNPSNVKAIPPLPFHVGLLDMELWEPPSNAVFIDPENKNGKQRNGSKDKPFASFDEVKWKDNTIYAIKRGTELYMDETLMLLADGVTLASYGEGNRPRIISSTDSHVVSTKWEEGMDISIRDIEIYAPEATSGIIIRTGSRNAKIINCKIEGPRWGIRVLNYIDGVLIHNTEISQIDEDGVFIQHTNNIEISNNYIHKVNRLWEGPGTPEDVASGDGIQLYLCNNWHVHHNIIDRSDSGNKFCFISNNPQQNQGIFENNYLKGPILEGFAIYIGDGRDMIFRYNYMEGNSKSPLWTHAHNLKIYYNIFVGFNGPLLASRNAEIYNNVFYDMNWAIEGGEITAMNNIFSLRTVKSTRIKAKELNESNNLYALGIPTRTSLAGEPGFADPGEGRFQLLPQSPGVGSGKFVGIRRDFAGNPVMEEEGVNMGAFQCVHPK